jgi:hypothetical protein
VQNFHWQKRNIEKYTQTSTTDIVRRRRESAEKSHLRGKKESRWTSSNPPYITIFTEITETYVIDDNQLLIFPREKLFSQLEMMDRVEFQCGEQKEMDLIWIMTTISPCLQEKMNEEHLSETDSVMREDNRKNSRTSSTSGRIVV